MVYVDEIMVTVPSARWPFKASCHLYADTEEELHWFAGMLGLKRSWFQTPEETGLAHYDLTASKRRLAVALGARQQSIQEAAEFFSRIRPGIVPETP